MPHNDGQLPLPSAETPQKPVDMDLDHLVSALANAKATELLAKDERIKWEERVAAKVGGPDSGQETVTLDDGTKVTVTRGFNFKADCDAIRKLFRHEGYDHAPPVYMKAESKLDIPAYKIFAEVYPSIYRKVAAFVTVTPKKIAVALKAPKVGK